MMQYLKDALSLDGTLDNRETDQRTQFLLCACIGICATSTGFAFSMQEQMPVALGGTALLTVGFSIGLLAVLCKVPLRTALVVGVLYVGSAGILMWDLDSRALSDNRWPLLVLVIDLMLVMRVPTFHTLGLVGFVVLWLVVLGLEESFRFGLFDLPGLPPQKGEYGREYYHNQAAECGKMPCPVPFPARNLLVGICVFVMDFVVTRGFASEVLKEQASMERTISTVQEIASLLARYDVEKVAQLLEEHEDELPQGMTVALRALEANLRSYKAYLPQTCLLVGETADVDNKGESLSGRESFSTCSTTPSSVLHEAVGHHVALGLSSAKATLLTVNIKDTLRLVEQDSAHFSSFFTTLLLKTLQATETHHGMVDVFIGDRVHCSFNASKHCANHATSALHTATMLLKAKLSRMNIGVATGNVLRGDMGCEVMRRFSMVGTLVRDVHGMERAGRILGCDVLCNRLCFSEAECEHEMRLIPCKVEVSATSGTPEVVAELLINTTVASIPTEEWMYQIGNHKKWENYNTAVRKYLKGDVSAAAVEEAAQGCLCDWSPLNVHPSTVKGALLSVALPLPLEGAAEKCF